jgi:hypothetical protein
MPYKDPAVRRSYQKAYREANREKHIAYCRNYWRKHHPPKPQKPFYEVEESGCWNWLKYRNGEGYGVAWHEGRTILAHRFYYENKYGFVPKGLELDHLCRNRGCVNPDHVEPVTHLENLLRGKKTKLTPQIVQRIRTSTLSGADLGRLYSVTAECIYAIRKGRTWSHLVGQDALPFEEAI